jgi:hypothetical protein
MGSRSLDATAGTEVEMVSGSLGSGSPDPRPGFSVDWRTLAIVKVQGPKSKVRRISAANREAGHKHFLWPFGSRPRRLIH